MRSRKAAVYGVVAGGFGIATAFFVFYGVQLVYAALTFTGEGSLGHVGMNIAAVLFPFLAFVCGSVTFLAWRAACRRPSEVSRPPSGALKTASERGDTSI